MRIRKGKNSDIAQLIKLYSGVKEVADFPGQKHDKGFFKTFMKKDKLLLVAENNKRIVGALNAEFIDDAKYTFFNNIVVSKNSRGKGIGKAFMKELEKESKKRKHKHIFALVHKWNKPIQKINEKQGYKVTGNMLLYTKKL